MKDDLKKIYRTVMDDDFPPEMSVAFGDRRLVYRKRTWTLPAPDGGHVEKGLRYGENPGQQAALYELVSGVLELGGCEYIRPGRSLVSGIREEDFIRFGKHPGKTNLTDIDNALNILKYLGDSPCCAIMKHNNPSGVARGETLVEAYERAYFADRIAAFGGCVVLNRPVDRDTAEAISRQYAEVVAAPDYEEGTVEILARRKNLRIVRIPGIARLGEYVETRFVDFKCLMDGGIIVQQSPVSRIRTIADFMPAEAERKGEVYRCRREPTERELQDLLFGWFVEMGVSSNSVLFVKDGATVAIGTGEQDRVGVTKGTIEKAYLKAEDRLAFEKHGVSIFQLHLEVKKGLRPAEELEEIRALAAESRGGLAGSVMVSDAFFPFRDAVDLAIAEGVTAIAHPGGSLRDWESIEACNEADPPVAMVFTGQRAFKH